MNRREFLNRMFAAGLVAASPKLIFDLGANSYRQENIIRDGYKWNMQERDLMVARYIKTRMGNADVYLPFYF